MEIQETQSQNVKKLKNVTLTQHFIISQDIIVLVMLIKP